MSSGLKRFAWIGRHTRGFPISGNNVAILQHPGEYFRSIKDAIKTAQHRIIMSSLYLGSGEPEQEIVYSLQDSVKEGKKVTMLLDHLRGSRGLPNSRTMLSKLITKNSGNFQLYLYHTPSLRGLVKRFFPERFNEGFGLQHTKLFIFDDNVMLTGANMSDQYFINRQDRYMWFNHCPELADYFASIVEKICDYSFSVTPDGNTSYPRAIDFNYLNTLTGKQKFITSLRDAMNKVIQCRSSDKVTSSHDTIVYPLMQMGQYGIRQEEQVMAKLLEECEHGDHVHLASGYFNLPKIYMNAMLRNTGSFSVLSASPQANGFFGASGIPGHVPSMYIHFAHQFMKEIQHHSRQDLVKYLEFFRKGWTFHGKGLWYTLRAEVMPSLTFIGSSNFGNRSLVKDLEAQVALVTNNPSLRESLHKEKEHLFSYATQLQLEEALSDPCRKLLLWEWIATNILKQYV